MTKRPSTPGHDLAADLLADLTQPALLTRYPTWIARPPTSGLLRPKRLRGNPAVWPG